MKEQTYILLNKIFIDLRESLEMIGVIVNLIKAFIRTTIDGLNIVIGNLGGVLKSKFLLVISGSVLLNNFLGLFFLEEYIIRFYSVKHIVDFVEGVFVDYIRSNRLESEYLFLIGMSAGLLIFFL